MAYNEQAGQWVAIKVLNRTDIKLNELSWQVKREVRWNWPTAASVRLLPLLFAWRIGGPLRDAYCPSGREGGRLALSRVLKKRTLRAALRLV